MHEVVKVRYSFSCNYALQNRANRTDLEPPQRDASQVVDSAPVMEERADFPVICTLFA